MQTFAQQDSTQSEIERQLEETFEEIDTESSEITGEQLTQFLEDLAANPVNINRASVNDLLQVPGFNLIFARALIDYRNSKPFESIEELKEVPGIGEFTYRRMMPYVTVGGTASRFRDMYSSPGYWVTGNKLEVISRMQQNIQEQEGYIRRDSSGGYLGNSVKYYQRIKMQSNHLSLNLTQEKDAGEQLAGITDFDYNSGHIAFLENGKLNSLVIGDYSLSFGQGLVLWTGGSFGKGREVTGTVGKNERGLRPYSSAQETYFFRGVAASYGEKVEVTAFYSDRPQSASAVSGDTTRFPSSSGFHRTQSELDRKNNIDQQTVGGRVKADTRFGLFGISGYSTQFSSYIAKGTSPDDLYDFEGTGNSVVGADYRGLIGNALVFGEIARSENSGLAGIIGVEAPIGSFTSLSLLLRNYQKEFQNFMGTGFGESSGNPQNEKGFYVGLKHLLSGRYTISGYFDQYSFESPRSGVSQASQGYDMLGMIEGRLSAALNAYVLLRNEIKDESYEELPPSGRMQQLLGTNKRASVRTQIEYQVSRRVRLRSRVELVRNRAAGESWESGFLIYQDVRLQLTQKLQLDARATIFDTKSFDTRVYQFENDLLYVMSNVALSDRGQRIYALIKYEATDYLDFWLKYGITVYEDAQSLSSGLGEIEGNRRSTIGIQGRLYLK